MRPAVYSILALLILFSCENEELSEKQIPDGTYSGTFQRQFLWTNSKIANITLIFHGNQWSGSINIEKYPALCRGTYTIKGDTIIFENECAWTAEFDWTLILAGKYVWKKTSQTLEFSKDYRSATKDTYTDEYKLTKQE